MTTALSGPSSVRVPFVHHALRRDEAAIGRPEEQRVEEGVGPEDLPVAGGVGPVGVDERRIEVERRHGHQLDVRVGRVVHEGTVGPVGGAHQAQVRIDGEHVGTEPGPGGQEGHPPGRRLEPLEEHALVDLHHLDLTLLARRPPVRVQGDRIQGDEPAHHLLHLAGGAQQPHIGPAVGHDGQVVQIRAAQGAHDRHGLAARAPAADADGHARAELSHNVVDGGALVSHGRSSSRKSSPCSTLVTAETHWDVSAARFSTKAARCSSATPRTWSS